MSTDAIFEKYTHALQATTIRLGGFDQDAVRLALHLAISDAYGAGSALAKDLAAIVASQAQPERFPADQRYAEQLQAQINRLNEWLQEHEVGLYISPGDTADAVLAALFYRDERLAEARVNVRIHDCEYVDRQMRMIADWLIANSDGQKTARTPGERILDAIEQRDAEIDALRQQLAQLDTDNADLLNKVHQAQSEIDRLTRQNGASASSAAGVDPTPTPEWNRNHPAWNGFNDMQMLYRLHIGDLRFRNLSKDDRRDLVRRVLRHLAEAGEPVTGPHFDRLKPAWMPTAGAVVLLAESRKWQDLLNLAAAPA